MKNKFKCLIGIVLFQWLLIGCVNDSNKSKANNDDSLIEFEAEAESEMPVEMIFYRFPSPEEIFKYIKSTDLQYNSGSLNTIAGYKNYVGLKKQALNLGVYISDLAYITMFEQHDASLEYFMAIHRLSEELKISAAYSEPLVNRIGDNMGNSDSLVVIASDAYKNIVDYLVEQEQEDLLAYISTGALIESLYLIVDYAEIYQKDNDLINRVLNQKYVISNLSEYLKQHQKDIEIIKSIDELNELFLNLEANESEITIEKTKSNKLVIGGGAKLSISAEDYLILKGKILEIRENFVKIK